MPLPARDVAGILAGNLRLRGSVLPIPAHRATRWARGPGLPRGGSTVLYTGMMYQLIPYIERLVTLSSRLGDSPLARLSGLGRRANRMVSVLGLAARPPARERAEYDRILVDIARLLRSAGSSSATCTRMTCTPGRSPGTWARTRRRRRTRGGWPRSSAPAAYAR